MFTRMLPITELELCSRLEDLIGIYILLRGSGIVSVSKTCCLCIFESPLARYSIFYMHTIALFRNTLIYIRTQMLDYMPNNRTTLPIRNGQVK